MEEVALDRGYWEADAVDLRGLNALDEDLEMLRSSELLRGMVVFETSGSSGGRPKWVALSKSALRRSAVAVSERLGAEAEETWALALPDHHVGGFGVLARAAVSGGRVVSTGKRWDAAEFVELLVGSAAVFSSLVPTQLYDLVQLGTTTPPPQLRALLVGGGKCSDELLADARKQGWPVYLSYGMTEAGSTVAIDDGTGLELLPIWEAREMVGELWLRGEALFSAYVELVDGNVSLIDRRDCDGWFSTGDLGFVVGRQILVSGRSGSVIKVVGELVDLDRLQAIAEEVAQKQWANVALIGVPDERCGHSLLLVLTAAVEVDDRQAILEEFAARVRAFERPAELVIIPMVPRSSLGKIRREELLRMMGYSETS